MPTNRRFLLQRRPDGTPVKEDFELVTEPITEPSSPTPEMGPVEGTMEYWRFLFAGQAMQGILSSGVYAIDDNGKYISNPKETSGSCVDAVQWADAYTAAGPRPRQAPHHVAFT